MTLLVTLFLKNVLITQYYWVIIKASEPLSLTPDSTGNLLIDVALSQKLEISYHKIIPFQQEMKGSAEIVTEDLRLTERLLYQFRDIFRR